MDPRRLRDMRQLVEAFGFELRRTSGSHHVFVHPNVPEPYQFLRLVERYALRMEERR